MAATPPTAQADTKEPFLNQWDATGLTLAAVSGERNASTIARKTLSKANGLPRKMDALIPARIPPAVGRFGI